MRRRQFLSAAAVAGSALGAGFLFKGQARSAAPGPFKITKTDAEWRAALSAIAA